MTSRDNENARLKILESAAQLFAENGVHATSLADISQRAQVSKGTLYYHYTTKEKLVTSVCEVHIAHTMGKLYAWLDTVKESSDVRDALSELLDMLTDDTFHVRLHIALCSEAALGQHDLQQFIKAKYAEMGLIIDLASLRMDIVLHDMPKYKQMFFMALDGLMLHSLMGLDPIDSRSLLQKIYSR